MYRSDFADTETMLRLIQSIPSPKAEPIKQWLAKVGAQQLQQMHQEQQAQEVNQLPAAQPVTSVAQEIREYWQQKPEEESSSTVWADYLERLVSLYRRQASFEAQLQALQAYNRYVESELDEHTIRLSDHGQQIGELHSRVESLEEGQRLLPELLERLGPRTLTPEQQAQVKQWVNRLCDLTGWPYRRVYGDLNADFRVGTFSAIREEQWERVVEWFRLRLAAAEKRRNQN